MREGEVIKELIDLWLEYSASSPEGSLAGFAKWMSNRLGSSDPEEQKTLDHTRISIGELFGRLINYTELWGKLAFQDLPIRQFEDFGILTNVKYMGNPSKNELANLLIIEKSTVFEIIKRLVRDGLLQEEKDQHDKRIRRVRLTDKGAQVAEQAMIQAKKVSVLLLGDSSPEEVHMLHQKFTELDGFHRAHYERGGYNSIDDLLRKPKPAKD